MVENLYHLFVPWDDYNTIWVCLLLVVVVVRVNQRIQNNIRKKYELDNH
tara:strand:+ start:216 stop:362 length:147 start_codon:yes stop_codon:yes gene_type:complete